jgi:hypothetical protein
VTDFFVRLGRSREDFRKLLDEAMPEPPAPLAQLSANIQATIADPLLRQNIERIKRENPIDQ